LCPRHARHGKDPVQFRSRQNFIMSFTTPPCPFIKTQDAGNYVGCIAKALDAGGMAGLPKALRRTQAREAKNGYEARDGF